ncbi:MAG: hypothetical protein IKI75_00785 [Lachnospiraceae bacterium]|nr:hypothetical protein [Lachnospiraceae bacterium]
MRELTTGDRRFVSESINSWKMLVNITASALGNISQDVTDHIDDLADSFVKGFSEFYENAPEDPAKDADDLLAEYEESFITEHPEYADMRLLFADPECDPQVAEEAFSRADELLGRS